MRIISFAGLRTKKQRLILTLIFGFFCVSNLATIKLNQIENEDIFLIYYSALHEYVVPHVLKTHHIVWNHNQGFWGYEPWYKPFYFINDFTDYGNAGATGIPFNYVSLNLAPSLNLYDIIPQTERVRMLTTHELTHVVAMDQSNKKTRLFRNIFRGKPSPSSVHPESVIFGYLTVPRYFSPRWYHEGIAVFMETWQNGGVGRTMGSYDEMFFRSLILENKKIYSPFDLEAEGIALDFSKGSISYIYGTRFVSYLAIIYGPQKVIDWFNIDESEALCFSRGFRNTFNISLSEAWEKWIAYEKEWQEENLARIHENPLTEVSFINKNLQGSFSNLFFNENNGKIYTAYRPAHGKPQLIKISPEGGYRVLTTISNSATYLVSSLAFDQENEIIFYTTNNWSYRYLWQYNIRTNKKRLLIRNLRAGSLAYRKQDQSLWGVRHHNGICTLIRLDYPYTDWTALRAFPFGTDIFDLSFNHDGTKLIASISEYDGTDKIAIFEVEAILDKDLSYTVPVDFGHSSPNNFVFTGDSNAIYGTSYYTGVSNIFYHCLQKNETRIITNTDTGLFKPLFIDPDTIIALKYTTTEGFSPVLLNPEFNTQARSIKYLGQEIVDQHPIVKNWAVDFKDDISFRNFKEDVKQYSFVRNLRHLYSYPFVAGYKNNVTFGIHTTFSDKTNLLSVSNDISVSPSESLTAEESIHWSLNVRYVLWNFFIKYNYADFYDLFGPEKFSRKGTQLGVNRKIPFVYDESIEFYASPELSALFNGDVVSGYQNIKSRNNNVYEASNSFLFQNIKGKTLTENQKYGYAFELFTGFQNVDRENFYKAYVKADAGLSSTDMNISLWLRSYTGKAFGKGDSPYSSFYFGGFRNNYVDFRDSRRFRSLSAFPGVSINSIDANSFSKITAELNLPAFYGLKGKSLNLIPKHLQTCFFSSIMLDSPEPWTEANISYNYGFQADLYFILLSQLQSTISLGYARAFHQDKHSHELMASLRLLK